MDESLNERFLSLKEKIATAKSYVKFHSSRKKEIDEKRGSHIYNIDLRQKESEIFKRWLHDMLEENIESMEKLVTSGLNHVIHDQKLAFRIRQEVQYDRVSMKFGVEQLTDSGTVEGDPINSFGGGAAVLISLILRVAVMSKMKMGNLLLLDESLAALANVYVPNAAAFMRQLSEKTGINILIVTHNPSFLEYAHTAYEATSDGSRMTLKSLESDSSSL